jgi:hypothetical protein
MKSRNRLLILLVGCSLFLFSSCKVWNNLFGPSMAVKAIIEMWGRKNLSGEKVPKGKKFKA